MTRMHRLGAGAFAAIMLLHAPMLRAQGNPNPARPNAAQLRGQIENGFRLRVTRELALLPETAPRVERIINQWGQQRTRLEREERQLHMQLNGHLRPGIAANETELTRVIDALNENRIAYAQTFRDEMRELAPLLTAVQRGQYQQLRDRFLQQVLSVQQNPGRGQAGTPIRPKPEEGTLPPK